MFTGCGLKKRKFEVVFKIRLISCRVQKRHILFGPIKVSQVQRGEGGSSQVGKCPKCGTFFCFEGFPYLLGIKTIRNLFTIQPWSKGRRKIKNAINPFTFINNREVIKVWFCVVKGHFIKKNCKISQRNFLSF